MEKLIEYYNEYYQKKNLKEYYDYVKDMVLPEKFDSLIFLKDFCKWLVENDKIDKRKIDTKLVKSVESHYDEDGYWVENSYEDYSNADTLLMLLSISEKPMKLLISILK